MHWIAHVEGGPRRVNHAATAVDHIIYTFGGFQTGAHYRKSTPIDVHILNTVTFRWTRLGKPIVYKYKKSTCPVPFQRYGHSAVTYYRKIFIWGGRNETVSCNKLYCFDTETLNWSKPTVSGDVPSPRDGHSACVIADRMYVFGGFTELTEKISNELYYLDLITMRWQHVVQEENEFVPKFRDFHTATKIGPYMFVFGGRSDSVSALHSENDEYCPDIVYFDTDTHTWHKPVTTGDIPSGRRSHSAFAINGKLYIWGGYSGVTDEYFNDLYEFNPNTNIWTKIEANGIRPMPRRRQGCVVVDNKAFIFGGTSPLVDVFQYSKVAKLGILPKLLPLHLFYGNVEDELMTLNDVNVLDFAPSLYSLALQKVINENLDTSELPLRIRQDISNIKAPNGSSILGTT